MSFFKKPPTVPPHTLPLVTQEWPPGHYYSPIPSAADVQSALQRSSNEVVGIDINTEAQLAVLEDIQRVYPRLRFPEKRTEGRRYFYDNGSFGALDAVCLAAMVARYRPKRVVEVGSGFSSAALLDLREDGIFEPAEFLFIDPDFSRVEALIWERDRASVRFLRHCVQAVPLSEFESLAAGDLLFIDSSHVSKAGSDVNFLIFEVFPKLAPGVIIHIHDIFDGFEYPKQWFDAGRYWNEQYVLRAFLMFNSAFEVLFHSSNAFNRHTSFFREQVPVTLKSGGGQLWMRRL